MAATHNRPKAILPDHPMNNNIPCHASTFPELKVGPWGRDVNMDIIKLTYPSDDDLQIPVYVYRPLKSLPSHPIGLPQIGTCRSNEYSDWVSWRYVCDGECDAYSPGTSVLAAEGRVPGCGARVSALSACRCMDRSCPRLRQLI